ncbi:MAG: NADP-dependent isocitrate dehydrogenase [Anaerolineae bacterium]|jgi:isocitrate dehydrogenase|nr:NADP-dependent isocitrate dehydrogenase [Anaerolineae bacterium]
MSKVPITVAYGDGIGPEIMAASLRILEAAGAQLAIETIEIGEKIFLTGNTSGIPEKAWESIKRTGIIYKGPITTPQGGGFKSINVTIRKTLGLYSNVRPVMSYYPFIDTRFHKVDIVIIRENEEDLYAGIEHRQTHEVYQTLKLISRPGSERINRYAFEYAQQNGRKKVTCFTKDNIMKMTDGLFHKVFNEIAAQYPEIEHEHKIIDIGAARAATRPEDFDVIVMPNLYGDVVSDIVAELTGSVGLAGSANVGDKYAMFEAIHGSAPDIAGMGIANPSGLLLGGVMMMVHIGQNDVAEKVHNAWLKTIEDGIHTGDIYRDSTSKQRVNTEAFADAVIERLGQTPQQLPAVKYSVSQPIRVTYQQKFPHVKKELVGVDLFLHWDQQGRDPNIIGEELSKLNGDHLQLIMITNRGQKVWPAAFSETFNTDHWRCRFMSPGEMPIKHHHIISLLQRAANAGYDFIKTENLYMFEEERGFSLGQGQ